MEAEKVANRHGAGGQDRGDRVLGPLGSGDVAGVVQGYSETYDAGAPRRRKKYSSMVNQYYDLVTSFYEFGWGNSFHFAPAKRGESFRDSLLRHQHFLADRIGLKAGMRVADIGCGVGGPLGNLVRHSGAHITGVNNNAFQIERARKHNKDHLDSCDFLLCDFMNIPAEDASFDAAYQIEATPHAPDKVAAYREVFRILKPGGVFGGYEWCVTDRFDPSNPQHLQIKEDIMRGDALPDIATEEEVVDALKEAGFEGVETRDRAFDAEPEAPWWLALDGGGLTLSGIARTPLGRSITNLALRVGEKLRLAPQGSRDVSTLLNVAADALVEGGKTGTFTPMFFHLARKPQ